MKKCLSKFLMGIILLMGICPSNIYCQPAVYCIHLGVVKDQRIIKKQFHSVQHLGFLRTYGTSRGMNDNEREPVGVSLGPYLGFQTATEALRQVQITGFPNAYIINGGEHLADKAFSYTVQVGAFKKMNAQLYETIATLPANGMFICYEQGLFKIFSGLYSNKEVSYLNKQLIPYYRNELGLDGFVRKL